MSKQRQPEPEVSDRLKSAQRRADDLKFRRDQFIRALAKFLVDNQAGKSIALQMHSSKILGESLVPWPIEWSTLRQATYLHGYPTIEEAELELREFLGWS